MSEPTTRITDVMAHCLRCLWRGTIGACDAGDDAQPTCPRCGTDVQYARTVA